MNKKGLLPRFLPTLALGLLAACGAAPAATPSQSGSDEVAPTAVPVPTAEPATAAEPVEVRWFIGMCCTPNLDPQQAIVDEFNASQDRIELVIDNDYHDDLAALSAENVPDIFGPMGIRGRDSRKGAWLDLQPLIDATGYDLSDFDPAMIEFFQDKEEGQLGIPLGIYPSFIFVNTDLFDAAGLPHPPQRYGAPYLDENGEERPWNLDTLRELAMKLTLDTNGNNATSPYFDAENIVQFGYMEQYTDMRGALTLFGPGSFVADDIKSAQIPDHWRAGSHWIYAAMWKDHFWPTDAYANSELLGNGSPFQSGHLAMAHVHMWFAAAWALDPDVIDFSWDTAAVPAYNGKVTAKMHADSFYISKASRNPEAAFEVLTYLSSAEVAPKVLEISDIMPARMRLQEDFLTTRGETVFPGQEINWQTVLDSVRYADNPNHESWMPSYFEASEAYTETWTKFAQEPGLDVDAELDALLGRLIEIFTFPVE